jgi:molybdopterin biosynthesis enzyme
MFNRLLQLRNQLTKPVSTLSNLRNLRNIHHQAAMTRRTDGLIATAGCIIIGDEVLGGKTQDTNSNFFAKYCFKHGIALKRIEVIPDDEADIIETVRRMSSNYDFVITSGGIGPT